MNKEQEFKKFVKETGGEYIHPGMGLPYGQWKIPKKCGEWQLAIKMHSTRDPTIDDKLLVSKHGSVFVIGIISEHGYFENKIQELYAEEGIWLSKTLPKILKWFDSH